MLLLFIFLTNDIFSKPFLFYIKKKLCLIPLLEELFRYENVAYIVL